METLLQHYVIGRTLSNCASGCCLLVAHSNGFSCFIVDGELIYHLCLSKPSLLSWVCTPCLLPCQSHCIRPSARGHLCMSSPAPTSLQVLPLYWALEGVKRMQKSLALNQAWNPILSELTSQLFLKIQREKEERKKEKKPDCSSHCTSQLRESRFERNKGFPQTCRSRAWLMW